MYDYDSKKKKHPLNVTKVPVLIVHTLLLLLLTICIYIKSISARK